MQLTIMHQLSYQLLIRLASARKYDMEMKPRNNQA